MNKEELYGKVIEYFRDAIPSAETELAYSDAYQLLVAVILSAQCTDKRVNLITPALFERFPTPQILAEAETAEVLNYIRSCSYPNNKAKHLTGMARKLVDDYDGVVPADVDELQKLPGVGRKTANVIASVVFGQPAFAVDTHVFRVAARIGLTDNAKTPLEAEKQLTRHFPKSVIPQAHHWLILHGRYVCMARNPKCEKCGLTSVCRFFANRNSEGKRPQQMA